jgi:hypothetical protein
MANRDPAFLWETEALRTSPSPAGPADVSSGRHRRDDRVTLRQASDAAGIPLSTIRTWVKKGRVPTTLEEFPDGNRRIVSLDAVRARARSLGHDVEELEQAEEGSMAPPPGTMLVPIDAWDKMLIQLGNLHQAGQELAVARERAARAETEATFLRERLAELRATTAPVAPEPIEASVEPEPAATVEEHEPAPVPGRMPRFSAYLWRLAVSDRRKRG